MSKTAPNLRIHKHTHQAYIVENGQCVYLGRHDDPETLERYRARVDPLGITVIEIAAQYLQDRLTYFGGPKTSGVYRVKGALRPLVKLFGELPAAAFGPLKLRTVREEWIKQDLTTTTINGYVQELCAMFQWASSFELVENEVHKALRTVPGLRRGRGVGKDPQTRDVVPLDAIEKTLPKLSRQLAAVVRLQLLTGARPSELLNLRRQDLDTTGSVWFSALRRHKTAYLGRERRVFFGPQAQAILKPFLLRADDAYLFSPREAEAERYAKQHAGARSPRRDNQKPNPRKSDRGVGECYNVTDYARAVRRVCDEIGIADVAEQLRREDPALSEKAALQAAAERYRQEAGLQKKYRWTPHRLRHTAATNAEASAGFDVARALLGHTDLDTTQIYVHKDFAAAAAYASKHG